MASSTRFSVWFAIAFLVCNCCIGKWGVNAGSKLGFDSIYQFGDSISDTGNLMRVLPWSSCSHSPYGISFLRKPTGRCSDGLLSVDYFAKAFKLPLLNPYLQRDADFRHGVNFAVAGATALNTTKYPRSSLSIQIEWFRSYVNSTCSSLSVCESKFKKALFLVGEIGGNDYNYAMVDAKSIPNAMKLVPDVIQSITTAVKEVINYGARYVVVPGNFPMGCMPGFLRSFKSNESTLYDNLGCLKSLNEVSRLHNERLKQAINDLRKDYPGVKIYYGDSYSGSTWILQNAASLGFDKDKLFEPCCGNASYPCGSVSEAPLCKDPKKRLSWDGTHPTQEAYKNLAKWLLSNTFNQSTTAPSPSPSTSSAPTPKDSAAHVVSIELFGVVAASILALWVIG